jgi:CheY-like chemotaxis protein
MSRILVVDDDNSILDLMRALLESEGHQVQAFSSGTDALADALSNPPDAAVVDLMMPGMNGIEFIQALRYDHTNRNLPVLLCSAYYGNLRYLSSELDHADISCLRKPFQIQELLDSVARMVADRRVEPTKPTESAQKSETERASAPLPFPAVLAQPRVQRSQSTKRRKAANTPAA